MARKDRKTKGAAGAARGKARPAAKGRRAERMHAGEPPVEIRREQRAHREAAREAAREATRKGAPRVRRPARAKGPVPAETIARRTAMMTAGVDQLAIVAEVKRATGRDVSRQSVGSVLMGRFANDDIIDAFCRLTGTERAAMFPAAAVRLDDPGAPHLAAAS